MTPSDKKQIFSENIPKKVQDSILKNKLLPAKFLGKQWMTSVKNQSLRGTCNAFATIAMIESFTGEDYSEQCLVYFQNTGDPEWPIKRMEYIASHGLYLEKDCSYDPYDPDNIPSNIDKKKTMRVSSKFKKISAKIDDPLNFIRERIIFDSPVVASVWVVGDWSGQQDLIAMPSEEQIKLAFKNPKLEGHAVVITGFDDDLQLLQFKNSWGTTWGSDGYGYMKYDYYLRLKIAGDYLVAY